MDPLTHVVVGRAIVAAAGRDHRRGPAVGGAAILGALSPDADAVIAFAGWDRYVRAHQFGTHALPGAIVMACLTAGIVRLFSARSRYVTLLAAALAGAMSHIALDLVSGARIGLGWPLLNRRMSVPLVAMADPWLIGICVGGLLALWPFQARGRTAARFVVVTTAAFLTFKASMLALTMRRTPMPSHALTAIDARWASLTEWALFERTTDRVRASAISSRGGPPMLAMSQPIGSTSPLGQASHSLGTVQNFLAVHEFAFASEREESGGRIAVLWSDLQYCWPDSGSVTTTIDCGVWVGGVFDRDGRAVTQEVKVGRVTQTRPPPP